MVRIEYKAGEAAKAEEEKMGVLGEKIAAMVKRDLGVDVLVSESSLKLSADELKVPEEQLLGAVRKFIDLYKKNEKILGKSVKFGKKMSLELFSRELFNVWKKQNKELEKLGEKTAQKQLKSIKEKGIIVVDLDFKGMRKAVEGFEKILILNKEGNFVFKGTDKEFKKLLNLGAKGGGKELKQGVVARNLVKSISNMFKF